MKGILPNPRAEEQVQPDFFCCTMLFTRQIPRTLLFALIATLAVSPGCRYLGPHDDRFEQVAVELDVTGNLPVAEDPGSLFTTEPLQVAEPVELDDLLLRAETLNPEIEEARLELESRSQRPEQMLALPDPELGTITHLAPVQTAAGEQQVALSINQKYVRPNKRWTQHQIAETEVNAARARLETIRQKVFLEIKNTYHELQFIQKALSILEADQQQLQLIDTLIDRRYRILQQATQQETLQVQVARSRLQTEIEEYRQLQVTLQAKLTRLVHADPGTRWQVTEPSDIDGLDLKFDRLVETAIELKPELHAQLFEIRRNRDATHLAELDHQPDFRFGLNYILTSGAGISPVADGQDAVLLTLGMNLPVYRERIDAGIREQQIKTLASVKKYERLKDETAESITILVTRFATLSRNLNLFEADILPKQKLTLDQSLSNYEVGKTDYLQLIDNWRKLLQYQIMQQRLRTDMRKTVASLEREIGVDSLTELN